MEQSELERAARIFSSRLATLSQLVAKAQSQWRAEGRDPATLVSGRLAPDMLPLPHQIVFACNQANDLVHWLEGSARPVTAADTLSLADLSAHVAATIERQKAVAGAPAHGVPRDKRIDLPGGLHLVLSGSSYVDDWLMPNFYFHLVTAYDILRHLGVTIGKADFMAHLADQVRQAR